MLRFVVLVFIVTLEAVTSVEGGIIATPSGYYEKEIPVANRAYPVLQEYGHPVGAYVEPVVAPVKERYGYVAAPALQRYVAPGVVKAPYGVVYGAVPYGQANVIPVAAKGAYDLVEQVPLATQAGYGRAYVATPVAQVPIGTKEVYGYGYVAPAPVKEYEKEDPVVAEHEAKEHGFFGHGAEGLGLNHKFGKW